MADFVIKPGAGVSNKLILKTQDNTPVLTTSASGVALDKVSSLVLTPTATASAPSGSEGALYYDSDKDALQYYDTAWRSITTDISGGIVTTYSGYKVHTFVSSGTFFIDTPKTVDILAVGGGGAGGPASDSDSGGAGGGGAGALKISASYALPAGNYTVIVGAGATGRTSSEYGDSVRNWDGGESSLGTILISGGGGAGGRYSSGGSGVRVPTDNAKHGSNGLLGSSGGGGGGMATSSGGAASSPGFAGGAGADYSGGGGGGASENGTAGSGQTTGGSGGNGASNLYRTGVNITYCTGGGGGPYKSGTVGGGGGDSGGGNESQHMNYGGQGNGTREINASVGKHGGHAMPNTGSGGGGGGGGANSVSTEPRGNGGNGGSGIVVIRYST